MFTRNFYNIAMADKSSSTGGCYFRDFQGTYRRVSSKPTGDGSKSVGLQPYPTSSVCNYTTLFSISYGFTDIAIGSGTNEESLEDYTLQYIPPTNFSCLSTGYSVKENGEDFVVSRYKILKYSGTENVTITEIGLMGWIGSTAGYPMLVYRKLLDEPIVVTPGMTFTLTIDVGTPVEE